VIVYLCFGYFKYQLDRFVYAGFFFPLLLFTLSNVLGQLSKGG